MIADIREPAWPQAGVAWRILRNSLLHRISPLTAPLAEQLAAALGSTFELERELGGGGMSRVYLARDRRLGRRIVVKLLAPELASGVSAERFEQEIQLAAGLQHPHIVPLLAAGEVAGLPYFSMPFIEGQSLRLRLEHGGPLSVPDTVRLLGEVASALAYAHARGLIHRDIKPDNVLLSPGGAMVTDFGVAKALRAATTGVSATPAMSGLTAAGFALGTPAYMAPEQAVGDPSTDARADLYAFGAMAYECLAGSVPFPGRSAPAMIAAHLTEPPPPLQERRPDLPPVLSALIMQCLAKHPDDRPSSAESVVAVLDQVRSGNWGAAVRSPVPAAGANARTTVTPATGSRPAAGWRGALAMAIGAIALIALVAVVRSRRGTSDARVPPAVPVPSAAAASAALRIAVLPFENIGDSSDAYFADGVADAVRGKLAELRSLEVIARGSSVPYAGTKVRPADVARDLGVRYLVTGTVRWAKQQGGVSRVLVAPELVAMRANAAPATEWSERFDAPVTDVFRVQADIAGRVAQALGLRLGGAEAQQLAARPTSDIVAYDAYLRAEEFTRRLESGEYGATDSAIKYYREAVGRDSNFARAWAKLAGAQSVNFINAGRPAGDAAPIHATLARVERLAPDAPETAYLRAQVAYNVDGDTAKAFAAIRAGLARYPANAKIVEFAGVLHYQVGRFDAALAYAKRVLELDPKSNGSFAGMSAVMARRYAEARPILDRAERMEPESPDPPGLRVASYLGEGDVAGARRALARAQRRLSPDGFTQAVVRWAGAPWILDSAQRRIILAAPLAGFDGFEVGRALAHLDIHDFEGDSAAGRRWVDSVLAQLPAAERMLGKSNPFPLLARAMVQSRLGRHDSALVNAAEALRLSDADRIGHLDPGVRIGVAYVLMRAGRKDEAVTRLEEVLRAQYMVSAAWLAVDPTWAPLRGHPAFDRLVPRR
jgi:TolB-like protein